MHIKRIWNLSIELMRQFAAWILSSLASALDELAWVLWQLSLKYAGFESMKTLDEFLEEEIL